MPQSYLLINKRWCLRVIEYALDVDGFSTTSGKSERTKDKAGEQLTISKSVWNKRKQRLCLFVLEWLMVRLGWVHCTRLEEQTGSKENTVANGYSYESTVKWTCAFETLRDLKRETSLPTSIHRYISIDLSEPRPLRVQPYLSTSVWSYHLQSIIY